MNVQEIMVRDVPVAERGTLVADVARLSLESGLGGVPVMEDGRLVGLVTDTDLVAKHAHIHMPTYFSILGTVIPIERRGADEEIQRVLAVTAGELMEREVPTVTVDASVEDVASLMVERRANPVPVLEGGRLVGLVSRKQLIGLLLTEEGSGASADSRP